MSNYKRYISKAGEPLWKLSTELAIELDEDGLGHCLYCKNTQPAEPDARKYICESCGHKKVYGAAELVLLGLTFS